MNNTYGMGKTKERTRKIVTVGMLSGISIFLGLSGLGLIVTPLFRITIMHIPVIIGAIIEGPIIGAILGLIFGLFSMYQNFTAPTATSFIFWNPIIALTPRILIGVIAYYVYKPLKNKFKKPGIAVGISAICASMSNTILVLGLTYIFYLERYAQALGISETAVAGTLVAVGSTNGVAEAIGCAVISIPVILGLSKLRKM